MTNEQVVSAAFTVDRIAFPLELVFMSRKSMKEVYSVKITKQQLLDKDPVVVTPELLSELGLQPSDVEPVLRLKDGSLVTRE